MRGQRRIRITLRRPVGGCSSMVERQLPKLHTRVRFPSPAPFVVHPSSACWLHSIRVSHFMRNLAILAGVVLFTALVSNPVRAGECSGTSNQTEMDVCADEAFHRADADLNIVYKQITDRLRADAGTLQRLTVAQRAWVAFRSGECDLIASRVSGGSIYPTILSSCLERITQLRTATLRGYLHCPEGDLSCPIPPG